jgi:hypothetical protein
MNISTILQPLGILEFYKLQNMKQGTRSQFYLSAIVKIKVVMSKIKVLCHVAVLSFGSLFDHRYLLPPLLLLWCIVALKRWQGERTNC